MRVGIGYDIHALVAGRPLKLGGILIPYGKGLVGHSDGDALLHAVTDALLGAAGLGDIGQHFPDTDPQYKNADSALLLQKSVANVREAGFEIGNVDATIIAQTPKLLDFIPRMRERMSQILEVDPMTINVKAKTNERLDSLGRGEGIAVQAVVLLQEV